MTKIELTESELIESFEEQLKLLKSHCDRYDAGDVLMYKEIAVKLRVLLHDTGSQKSLLFTHLKIQDLEFINSGKGFDPSNKVSTSSLIAISMSENAIQFIPKYDSHLTNELFDNWWAKQIILSDAKLNKFTRKCITLNVADKDGGAHVDSRVSQEFYGISKKNAIGITTDEVEFQGSSIKSATFTKIGEPINYDADPINSPIPATIRQIAEELIRTVESQVTIIRNNGSAKIVLKKMETTRDLQYKFIPINPNMPNTFENFQKVVTNYFPNRKYNNLQEIYDQLRNQKVSLSRLIKCYERNIEKMKLKETKPLGLSGQGWPLQTIIWEITQRLKK
jgi:hypothetical protein